MRQAAYEKAFKTLKEGRYAEAIRDFKNFIAAYPSGENTDNAYYWLAEAYNVNRDFPAARDTFRKLVKDFPHSPKVPDAYLKLGFIEYETGQYAAARDLLNDVIKRYPNTSAAKLAEKRLERMRQEKR
ncbi:tol-pal system protein YbgF [Candidatus Methylocalor cossyra]|uniref:Cell division coordinator CpoB n=1 Tax=Candidatus Methylocalor cossyra TaxID=3108543 RepID=A0ABM9NMI0_9GAMM